MLHKKKYIPVLCVTPLHCGCRAYCNFAYSAFACFRIGMSGSVGVFPEGKEVLIGGSGFGGVALHGVGAGKAQPGQRAPEIICHHSSAVN